MTTLDSYFNESSVQYPDQPALAVGDSLHSYTELREVQNRIAAFLHGANLKGRCVGLLSSKSLLGYGGFLGILSSGNIYVPLNPSFPCERLLRICREAGLAALIVDAAVIPIAIELLQAFPNQLVVLATERATVLPEMAALQQHQLVAFEQLPRPALDTPIRLSEPDAFAYLMFTSGSTGQPKGVPVTHASACACIEGMFSAMPIHPTDKFSQFAELSFDCSISDMCLCWKGGACLYPPSARDLMLPLAFVQRNAITVWSSVPTLGNMVKQLGLLKAECMPSIRITLFYGEALPGALASAWETATPSSQIFNFYGPTEAAILALVHIYDRLSDSDDAIVPIGNPLPGTDCRIIPIAMDADAEASHGELLLGGLQVGSGYWRNEQATTRAFVRLPDDPSQRVWYRTGDVVRLDPRRGFLFLGRRDQQVKVRGYRVELQEIESVLRRITGADVVAVVPLRLEQGRIEDLIAYCSVATDETTTRHACASVLPAYMVPRRVLTLNEFPLNGSGKLNYVALEQIARQSAAGSPPG